jgi:hypothetical protein
MRIKTLLCAAGLAATMAVPAMAQNVYSQNIVGYVNRNIPAGTNTTTHRLQYAFVANPLDGGVNGNGFSLNVLSNLFAALPVGSQVKTWNGIGFSTVIRSTIGSGWGSSATTQFLPGGQGAVIALQATNTNPLTVTFVGSVAGLQQVGSQMIGTYTNSFPAHGYTLQGYAAPIQDTIVAQGINSVATKGDTWMQWDEVNQVSYISTVKSTIGAGWGATPPNVLPATSWIFYNPSNYVKDWVHNFTVN